MTWDGDGFHKGSYPDVKVRSYLHVYTKSPSRGYRDNIRVGCFFSNLLRITRMSTLGDMAEIDQIAHWCYLLTLPWPWDSQGHGDGQLKVTARSIQLETAENILFLLFFFTIMFTLDNKVISRSQQSQIIYKKVIIVFAAFVTIMFTSDFAKTDSSIKPNPSPCHHVLVSMGYNPSSPFIIIL